MRLLPFTLLLAVGLAAPSLGENSQPPPIRLPVGRWRVEFANGVVEECDVGNAGQSTVREPRRSSNGMAYASGGAVEISYKDQRMERWTAVGQRYVVEHYYPAPRIPDPVQAPAPVLGIAERIK